MKIYHNVTHDTAPHDRLGWGPTYGVVATIDDPMIEYGISDVREYLDNWKKYWETYKSDKRLHDLYANFNLLNVKYSINPLPPDIPQSETTGTEFPLELRVYFRFKFKGDLFHLIRINELLDKVVEGLDENVHPYRFNIDTLIIGTPKDLDEFEKGLDLTVNQVPTTGTTDIASKSSIYYSIARLIAVFGVIGLEKWKK